MKKITIIHYILLLLSILIFISSIVLSPYGFSYFGAVIFIASLAIFIFVTGLIINKKEFYLKNINKYIVLYFILLLSLTLIINRSGISFLNKDLLKNYAQFINVIPLKTIINYIVAPANISIKIVNIIGNMVAFIPLSFLLSLKNKKYQKLKYQFQYLGITVLVVEVLQLITMTGRLDIDDFILNVGGALGFVLLINKLNIVEKLKKVFFQDFRLLKPIKYMMWTITIIFIVLINILLVIDMTTVKTIIKQNFYIEEKNNCNTLEKIEMNGYNLYLDCVDVVYETKDYYQMPLENALKEKKLTRKKIKNKLSLKNMLKDGGTATYTNQEENISIILCNTIEGNKDIYVGSANMKYKDNFCK